MILASAKRTLLSMSSKAGALGSGIPVGSRAKIEAKSKRKPSTCISSFQKISDSRIKARTTALLAFKVLPQPE